MGLPQHVARTLVECKLRSSLCSGQVRAGVCACGRVGERVRACALGRACALPVLRGRCAHAYMCLRAGVCAHECVRAWVCARVHVSARLCVRVRMSACVRVCVSSHVSVSVLLFALACATVC